MLQHRSQQTQSELTEATSLSARTIREALGQLVETGRVVEERCVRDARKRVYSLAEE
ncbi:ArsR family transcriptional regulator [Halosegnis marinus]|uniref:ArsR family transcriptional regulator n=1 Tax=Halosegnis marinus TaxID=3034023 RepID=UPI00361CBA4E